jgi:ArsR family transcriptional regulator
MIVNVALDAAVRGADEHEPEARLFRALMHPARLKILDLLREGEACVCHLEAALGRRQAYVSQQLGVLREAGLVQERREGLNRHYRVNDPRVYAVLDAARGWLGLGPGVAAVPVADCPCPRCRPDGLAVCG